MAAARLRSAELRTELAHACVEVGFEQLGLLEIVAFTLPDNIASRRVMEKAGFRYERDIVHAGLPHVLYRRQRALFSLRALGTYLGL